MLNNCDTRRPFIIYSLELGVEDFEGGSHGFQGEQRGSIRRQSTKGGDYKNWLLINCQWEGIRWILSWRRQNPPSPPFPGSPPPQGASPPFPGRRIITGRLDTYQKCERSCFFFFWDREITNVILKNESCPSFTATLTICGAFSSLSFIWFCFIFTN